MIEDLLGVETISSLINLSHVYQLVVQIDSHVSVDSNLIAGL